MVGTNIVWTKLTSFENIVFLSEKYNMLIINTSFEKEASIFETSIKFVIKLIIAYLLYFRN